MAILNRRHADHSHLLPDRVGLFREPLRVLRPGGQARRHDPAERVRARRLFRGRAAVAGDAAGRRGAAVAVCGGAGADGDGDAVAGGARRALARSHVARAASSRRWKRSSTCSRRCSRRSTKRRSSRLPSAAQRDLRRDGSSSWSAIASRSSPACEMHTLTPSGVRPSVRSWCSGMPGTRRMLSARTWRCCGRWPACSASCSRTSACSGSGRSRTAGPGAAAANQQVGAEGAARADQPALPVQRAQRDRLADSHRSGARRRSGRAAGRSVPLHAAAIRFGVGAARPGAGVRARLSRRRAGPLRPAPDVRHRLRSLLPAPQIPSMLLQTLLENAVKHGVSQARGPGRIDVMVRTLADQVTLEVRNTGPAPRRATRLLPRDGEGFGLHSVRERLKGTSATARRFGWARRNGRGHRGAHHDAECRRWPRDPRGARGRRTAGAGADEATAGRGRRCDGGRRSRQRRRGARGDSRPRPDLLFLDVEMPEVRGTALAASLPEPRPFIVFATAFDQLRPGRDRLDATDYLLKPVSRASSPPRSSACGRGSPTRRWSANCRGVGRAGPHVAGRAAADSGI